MKWLKIEDGSLVNLDHIVSVEIIDLTTNRSHGVEKCHVSLYPADPDGEFIKACEGSRSKCEDYVRALLEWVEGKEICAVGEHRCGCDCGCQDIIREDFTICDDCQDGYHWGSVESKVRKSRKEAALRTDAVLLDHFPGLAPLIKKNAA